MKPIAPKLIACRTVNHDINVEAYLRVKEATAPPTVGSGTASILDLALVRERMS